MNSNKLSNSNIQVLSTEIKNDLKIRKKTEVENYKFFLIICKFLGVSVNKTIFSYKINGNLNYNLYDLNLLYDVISIDYQKNNLQIDILKSKLEVFNNKSEIDFDSFITSLIRLIEQNKYNYNLLEINFIKILLTYLKEEIQIKKQPDSLIDYFEGIIKFNNYDQGLIKYFISVIDNISNNNFNVTDELNNKYVNILLQKDHLKYLLNLKKTKLHSYKCKSFKYISSNYKNCLEILKNNLEHYLIDKFITYLNKNHNKYIISSKVFSSLNNLDLNEIYSQNNTFMHLYDITHIFCILFTSNNLERNKFEKLKLDKIFYIEIFKLIIKSTDVSIIIDKYLDFCDFLFSKITLPTNYLMKNVLIIDNIIDFDKSDEVKVIKLEIINYLTNYFKNKLVEQNKKYFKIIKDYINNDIVDNDTIIKYHIYEYENQLQIESYLRQSLDNMYINLNSSLVHKLKILYGTSYFRFLGDYLVINRFNKYYLCIPEYELCYKY